MILAQLSPSLLLRYFELPNPTHPTPEPEDPSTFKFQRDYPTYHNDFLLFLLTNPKQTIYYAVFKATCNPPPHTHTQKEDKKLNIPTGK